MNVDEQKRECVVAGGRLEPGARAVLRRCNLGHVRSTSVLLLPKPGHASRNASSARTCTTPLNIDDACFTLTNEEFGFSTNLAPCLERNLSNADPSEAVVSSLPVEGLHASLWPIQNLFFVTLCYLQRIYTCIAEQDVGLVSLRLFGSIDGDVSKNLALGRSKTQRPTSCIS